MQVVTVFRLPDGSEYHIQEAMQVQEGQVVTWRDESGRLQVWEIDAITHEMEYMPESYGIRPKFIICVLEQHNRRAYTSGA